VLFSGLLPSSSRRFAISLTFSLSRGSLRLIYFLFELTKKKKNLCFVCNFNGPLGFCFVSFLPYSD
jgi:hypothetical protein